MRTSGSLVLAVEASDYGVEHRRSSRIIDHARRKTPYGGTTLKRARRILEGHGQTGRASLAGRHRARVQGEIELWTPLPAVSAGAEDGGLHRLHGGTRLKALTLATVEV